MESKLIQYLLKSDNSNHTVFYDENGVHSYFELMRMIETIEKQLLSFHFPERTNIIVALGNQVEAIATIIAIIRNNLVAVPVSVSVPNSLLKQYIVHVDAGAYVSLDDKKQISIHTINSCCKNYNNPNTCLILFTSGTTGKIKAVELSEVALLSTISSVIAYTQCTSDDCFFVIKDYVHCSCLISEIFVGIVSGSKICLYDPRLPFSILRRKIREHNVSIMGVNPWIIEMICMQPKHVDFYKSIRLLISSGSILTGELKRKALNVLPFAQIINVYGLTEACSRVCAQIPGIITDDFSVGTPINNVQVTLKLWQNDMYEVLIKSEGNMLGYYHDDLATKEKLIDGWIYSGDLGYFDSNNNLIILGRKDDLIISASNKVDPHHIDCIIRQFPHVKDSYTFGIPDDLLGEKVVSIIEYDANWNHKSLISLMNYCKEHLFSYECPSRIIPVDTIPRTFSGKALKKDALRLIEKKKYYD